MGMKKPDTIKIESGSSIAYKLKGKDHRPVVILANGSFFNFKQFDLTWAPKTRKYSKKQFRTLQYDYVGYGFSSPLQQDIDFVQISKEQVELLDALGIEEAHHVGISKGALISFLVGAAFPKRCMTVAGYGTPNLGHPSVNTPKKTFGRMLQNMKTVEDQFSKTIDKKNYGRLFNAAFTPTMFPGKNVNTLTNKEKLVNLALRRLARGLLIGTPVETIVKICRYYHESEPTEEESEQFIESMKNLQMPSLLMHGKKDKIVPFAGAKKLAEWIPNNQLTSYDSFKHTTPMENPIAGRKIVRDHLAFLRKQGH